jgi:sporulation protein YlmC with PRC-barrel domain
MTRYGTLGDYRFADVKEAADDIRGSNVYGFNDEKLGEIDDVIFDQDSGEIVYLVVDTGGWLSSKKFLVPPREVRPSVQHRDDYLVELSKEQIESFPPYDGEALSSEERWADYERRYRSNWETGPVMHRVATDRNVTPTTKQQVQAGSGVIPSMKDEEAEAPITPIRTEATMDVSATGPSLRWTTFEDRIRMRREEVLESSIRQAKRATSPTASAGEKRRKAS